MSDAPLYSVRQLADALQLPESTVRYYRDTYLAYIPVVGSGSRRLYPQESLDRLRVIRNAYAKGLSRSEIEARLTVLDEASVDTNGASPHGGGTALAPYDDALATLIDGERERREAMWQVAREIVRLGEVVERQQVMLGAIAQQVGATSSGDRTYRPIDDTDRVADDIELIPETDSVGIDGPVEAELATLREQLDQERELVERLRRSKVAMERRAAEAEALLEQSDDDGGTRQSILRRLLLRDSDA